MKSKEVLKDMTGISSLNTYEMMKYPITARVRPVTSLCAIADFGEALVILVFLF
jgi:hypothetical protein